MESALQSSPTLLTVPEFGQMFGLSNPQSYDACRKLPIGVVLRLGKRIRVHQAALLKWIEAGGSLSGGTQ